MMIKERRQHLNNGATPDLLRRNMLKYPAGAVAYHSRT
jgi:hypothetical protein